MELRSFPGCCTATVLTYLGHTLTGQYGGWMAAIPCTPENFFYLAEAKLKEAGRRNFATVIAITNSDQTVAIETLPKLGFVCVQKDLGKLQHADKTISTWVYTICDKDKKPLPVPKNPFAKEKPKHVGVHPALKTGMWKRMSQKNKERKAFTPEEWKAIREEVKRLYDNPPPRTWSF